MWRFVNKLISRIFLIRSQSNNENEPKVFFIKFSSNCTLGTTTYPIKYISSQFHNSGGWIRRNHFELVNMFKKNNVCCAKRFTMSTQIHFCNCKVKWGTIPHQNIQRKWFCLKIWSLQFQENFDYEKLYVTNPSGNMFPTFLFIFSKRKLNHFITQNIAHLRNKSGENINELDSLP